MHNTHIYMHACVALHMSAFAHTRESTPEIQVTFAKTCLDGCFRVVSHVSMRNDMKETKEGLLLRLLLCIVRFGSVPRSASFNTSGLGRCVGATNFRSSSRLQKARSQEHLSKLSVTYGNIHLPTKPQAQATLRSSLCGVFCFRCGSASCGPGCGCGCYCWCWTSGVEVFHYTHV